MASPLDFAVFLTGLLLEIVVVVCVCYRRLNLSLYHPIGFYMLCSALTSCGDYYFLQRFGIHSDVYAYFYFYSDALLTILLFWIIIHFYQQAFEELKVSRVIRFGAVALLIFTAAFSYVTVRRNQDHLHGHFVIELSQNLYFVGVVLTYLLWGTILKLKETRARLVQFVLALGIYFSGSTVAYALRNILHGPVPGTVDLLLAWIPPVMCVWLSIAWAYAFVKVPEHSRLITAQIEARATT
jgi:hypothetical protein